MQIPRVRIGLRTLMLLIAVAAVLCWLDVRRRRFERLTDDHLSRQALYLEGDLIRGSRGVDFQGRPTTDWESEWHRRLAKKYFRAAKRSWLPVAPDPSREEFRKEFRAEKSRRAEAGTLISPYPYSDQLPLMMPAPNAIRIIEPPPLNSPSAQGS